MIFSIFEQSLMALPLIMGAYLTFSLLKLPDFSIESAYLFGAVAAFLTKELPIPFVIFSAMFGGMMIGALVVFLNQFLHFPFLLAAIMINGLFHGLTQYLLGTSIASFHLDLAISEFTLLLIVGIGVVGILSLVVRSQLGYSMAIYGNNPRFFHSHNISGRYVLFATVMMGYGLAGISGFLFALSNGFVDLTMNIGIILLCLTTLIIGKFINKNTFPSIFKPIIGIIFYFLIQQILLRLGLNLKYFNAFQALFILIILSIGQRRQVDKSDQLGV